MQPPIIAIIVGDMFFRNNELLDDAEEEDEDDVEVVGAASAIANKIAKNAKEWTNVMKLFVKLETSEMYVVHIKNVTCYELALDHLGSGMSFRQTATAIDIRRPFLLIIFSDVKCYQLFISKSILWNMYV